MAHPTCALARLPNVPTATENSHKPKGDLVGLGAKAHAELDALREAYRAIACVRDLLQAQRSRNGEFEISRSDAEALVALVEAEFERRMQIAKASIDLMQAETPHRRRSSAAPV